jgi:hypothetical protein
MIVVCLHLFQSLRKRFACAVPRTPHATQRNAAGLHSAVIITKTMIIKHNAILILSTSFLGGSITAAADSTTAQRRLQLPPLQQTFSARGAPPNPLPNCHGDCDNDSHCAGDLVCFQRFGYEEVPGCSGSGFRKVDFCAERPTENTLWMKGNNGRPSSSFPLGLCEGDCDTDAECGPGLVW